MTFLATGHTPHASSDSYHPVLNFKKSYDSGMAALTKCCRNCTNICDNKELFHQCWQIGKQPEFPIQTVSARQEVKKLNKILLSVCRSGMPVQVQRVRLPQPNRRTSRTDISDSRDHPHLFITTLTSGNIPVFNPAWCSVQHSATQKCASAKIPTCA